jgi:hypothetical protein
VTNKHVTGLAGVRAIGRDPGHRLLVIRNPRCGWREARIVKWYRAGEVAIRLSFFSQLRSSGETPVRHRVSCGDRSDRMLDNWREKNQVTRS